MKDNDLNKICTFLTYPLYEEKINKIGKNKEIRKNVSSYVELTDNIINSDYFLEKMQIKNGILFLGLNQSEIGTQNDNYKHNHFQTMHKYKRANNEYRNTAKDYVIARLVHNTQAEGSFAFDIINGLKITHMPNLSELLCKMYQNHDELDKNKENFIGLPESMNNTSSLYTHIKNYDIPIFYKIVKKIHPKKVICFGKNSELLASTINYICHLNLKIFEIDHYSYTGNGKEDESNKRKKQLNNVLKC